MPSTRPVVTTNSTTDRSTADGPPPPTEAPIISTLAEKFPGVDFSRCEPLTSLAGRPVPIEAARCSFPGSILAEFYNFRPQDLESDVATWTPSALSSTGWNDGDGLSRGRVLDVVLANGQEGIYWTYDEDAYSVLAYGDPAVFVPYDSIESFWLSFDAHTF